MSFSPSSQDWHSPLPHFPSSAPPMLPPTSAPKPSAATPERRPKLRASCDACAASKVKCSKEHPSCARCAINGSQCIYGVSRKHGKLGRKRKRNPDGTPFIKTSKQQRPDGGEFTKFRVRPEPLLPDLPVVEPSSWPSTPDWPTSDFEYEMTPDAMYAAPDFTFVDDVLLTSSQPPTEDIQTIEPELTFRDPFAKKESLQIDLSLPSDFQALKNFIGGDSVNPMDYALEETTMNLFLPSESSGSPQSPKSSSLYFNPLRTSIAIPRSHCCYSLAYSTLETLQLRAPEGTQDTTSSTELRSLDSVLSVTKTAVQNVLQLLSCPCSADPHLAMLYSSIASKIITWYQIAAGLKQVAPSTPSLSSASSSSASSPSTFSSPLSTPSPTNTTFNIRIQPLKIGLFEFDEADQEALRRQVVLRELKKCGVLVEALANWTSEGDTEQAEFLYDVLGAWLKSELFKTLRDVAGGEE